MRNMARPLALLLLCAYAARAEILTPPYVNLALGKKITATATCGDEGPELYCKLVGANADHDEHVIQGQVCDICNATNDAKKHPPEYAVDGMETWWQSPPLSRGMKYNEINLTIDLGQDEQIAYQMEFHVAYVFLKMGNSPRPGLWALEKSTDYGKTFKPWQYFSDSRQDCERFFGKESLQPITRDDSVICSTEYSQIVPLEGGEIPISLLNYRPSANKYFSSLVLQEWTRATNVRLRLLRTKNLLAHLMSVARQDPTVTRRYFYSIKDISIGGRCMCNGHADNCDPLDPESDTSILVCRCQHNTCGPQCAKCCPGFEQKKWRISQYWDRFSCEPCNCHNHTTECEYDPEVDEKHLSLDNQGRYEGGGVCKNCQHNTEGINCNKCRPTYYRPRGKRWDEIDVCQPCECDPHYSTGNCEEETGRCECRKEFNPPYCDSCAYGYFDYPDCKPCICNLNGTQGQHCTPVGGMCPCKYNYAGNSCEICADGYYSAECTNCECNPVGSVSQVCAKDTGNCTCKSKYTGRTCDQCEAGYYDYPACNHCNCDISGTEARICDDVTGQCICKEGFGGARCDQCISGHYMEVRGRDRQCVPCECSLTGSTSVSCSGDGKCNCLVNFGGKQCSQCSPGYYKYPECLPCNCDVSGSIGSTCDDAGRCHCKPNFDGEKCDRCKEQYYNYPACEECNCDPRGVVASFAGCGSVPAGELCQCKERVQGRICNDCKPLFWNLQEYNPHGCEECGCHLSGTLGGLGACDTRSGACTCKMHVGERTCDQCLDGFYRLESDNVFGCTECDCDIGGSIDNVCDKLTGQCRCHSRVEGRRCDRPIRAHYFPTLHQYQYEVEEGLTQSGPVRYRNSEQAFPDYSWKGYVVFSSLQNEVINVVHVSKSSLYRMVVKYANPLRDPVVAGIVATPESVAETQQKFNVLLRPTTSPQLVTVAGEKGIAPSPFVMNPGNWTITIKTNKEVMIDYFVLIPESYYEATVLTKLVDRPCVVGERQLCRHFVYPNVQGRPADLVTPVTEHLDNDEQLKELNASPSTIPLLSDAQPELEYTLEVEQPGPHVVLIEYATHAPLSRSPDQYTNESVSEVPRRVVAVRLRVPGGEMTARVNLDQCPYTAACRQVVVDDSAKIFLVDMEGQDNVVYLSGEAGSVTGIKSVVAIPEDEWHLDYITPRSYCLRRDGRCEPAVFSAAVDSKKVEIESGAGGEREERPPILDNSTLVVYLTPDADPIRIESKVPAPGEYLFILHYYQPHHPASDIPVTLTADGVSHEGSVHIEHCPSNSGCRALLKLPKLLLADNFTVSFQGEETSGVWLDYVLAVAAADYTESALRETNTLDYTRQFIERCAGDNYYISPNDTGFCRDAMFSITAEYNSGALSCLCDYQGSTELECAVFGGQCPCRRHVVGRSCSACRTGYYGFPNCRPCHCPSTAVCDDNGQCICPKNVEGENCDRCKPYTFNFDVHRGCDDCNCNPLGVRDNRLQCEPDNGNCRCKENVVGRVCDHCVPGHYAFPDCVACSCHLAGSTEDVCDQNTALCYCKRHVRGQACNECKEEYFNLQASNPDGCTKCHCFGKTTRCISSYLSWVQMSVMVDWKLVAVDVGRSLSVSEHPTAPAPYDDHAVEADLVGSEQTLYFAAPQYYLGKRLTSYGGYLNYTIYYTIREDGRATSAPDVILGGPGGYLVHTSVEQPPSGDEWVHSVRLAEEEFTTVDGAPVSRDHFMSALVNVTSLYIRASYVEDADIARLSAVLDVAIDDPGNPHRASSVEECQCPKAYRGMSCEQCAVGYYRLSSGAHAGLCVPCQCNGHSAECDVNTGVCLDCQHNTLGDHCEQCIEGYHGDATAGTPRDCLICACPMPTASNNFAIGCELSENGSLISCDCKPGYGGPRCEFCAAGYYGEPEVVGDHCKPCNCSGNINVQDPGSCDSISGDCLKCVNNTAGAACNLCAHGFYGDAVLSKNCTACICDEYGMERCDPTTGTCVCRPGVEGEKCDRCARDHWGLNSGRGCSPCDCALAAEASQCDDHTGQCRCAKGVTGRHCDQCAAGYWNYTKEGCDHCNCNTGYSVGFMCNATGQCECLPGVIGEKCDRCPERWVLIPHEGCLECDECTDALIFTVQDLAVVLSNETRDFKDKADSFFTTQRLNYIASQTEALRPRVAELRNVDLDTVTAAFKTLETGAKNLLRSAEFAATDSDKQITRAADLATDAEATLASVRDSGSKAKETVAHVADLATGLELSQQPKVDSALAEARQIRGDIAEKSIDPNQASSVFGNATAQIERMHVFVQPVNDQAKRFERLVNATRQLKDKLEDLREFTDLAQSTAAAADELNNKNRQSKVGNKVLSVTKLNAAAVKELIEAAEEVGAAGELSGSGVVPRLAAARDDTRRASDEAQARLEQLAQQLPDLRQAADEAERHANALRDRADNLREVAARENNNTRTQDAYSAASAFSSIVQEIGDARAAAEQARAADDRAAAVKNELNERVSPARERSQMLLERAADALAAVEDRLRPNHTRASLALQHARDTLAAADDENNAIQLSLPAPPNLSLTDEIDRAERVKASVVASLSEMGAVGADLAASKAWARALPKQADDAQKMASNVHSYLKDVQEMDPLSQSKYASVKMMQEGLERRRAEADEKLAKLRELIEQARAVANRIQVGVTFDRHSTLQPRLPDSVDEMATSTHVSAYFRTRENDGFLLYLGNPKDTNLRRTKSDDFMVVGVQNGYPYLVMDIGDSAESGREPARIGSDKFVADNRWYQVVVDRVGRNVKFSIRESLDNGTEQTHSKEAVLPGQHTIFNLDRHKSKLYVGGVPAGARLQGVSFPAFEGQIEELVIGDAPVGLWNSVSATKLEGARQRDKLLTSSRGPQEYRFNGRSHVAMRAREYVSPQSNQVLLYFRTYAPNGLLYLVGEGDYFFSVLMQDGGVYLQVSLGNPSEMVIIGTRKTYNDGKWHKLDAGRHLAECSLKVDGEFHRAESSSPHTSINALDTMHFGGNNKGIVHVKNVGFDGCLRQISVDGGNVDLADNVEAVGLGYGCQFASLVSLSGAGSYLRYVDLTADNLSLTLKFRTGSADALIFLYVGRTQTADMPDSVSLALVNGRLVLMSQGEQLDTGLNTYNDSQWHVLSVTHNAHALRLVVDDFDYFSTDTPPKPLAILDGVVFVGGLQPGYVVGGRMGSKASLAGCVADASLNGHPLGLLQPHSSAGVTFGRCGRLTSTGGLAPDGPWVPATSPANVLPLPTQPPPPLLPDEEQENNNVDSYPEPVPARTTAAPTTAAPTTTPGAPRTPAPRPPRPPRPAPQPEPGCKLAYDPEYDAPSEEPEEGYRFGTREHSRIEYSKLPGRQVGGFDLSVEFSTFDRHGGLVFYAASDRAPNHFLALFLRDAMINLMFNCGGETAHVTWAQHYNDTAWHVATVVRSGGHGKLSVDGGRVGEASVACADNSPVLTPPFYFGGLRPNNSDTTHLPWYQPFKGCLRQLRMNGSPVREAGARVNALACSAAIEGGVYFGPSRSLTDSNYIKLFKGGKFRVGNEFSVSLEVKPRNSTGLLLSVHGHVDYMVLELMGDEVVARVENGRGPFQASYKLDRTTLCDGNWHRIHAVKSRHVVSVGVDGHFSDPGIGVSSSTDTKQPLYIGGHERPLNKLKGVRATHGYTGCVRNIVVKEAQVEVPLSAAGRNAHVGVCPID